MCLARAIQIRTVHLKDYCATQLIDGNGVFNVFGLKKNLMKNLKLAECGFSYAMVDIVGSHNGSESG